MSQHRSANAVSGKTARACDSCLRRRARWYCAADDAFLCQTCDLLVHSANPLARRHHRVRLKTASSLSPLELGLDSTLPTWHRGFKRKARTPRHGKGFGSGPAKPVLLVPDLEKEEEVDVEEQLIYRVPIFDPVLEEFCYQTKDETKPSQLLPAENIVQGHGFVGFNPSDMELVEFAADVENLLGQGMDDDSFCIDGLGLLDTREGVKMEQTENTSNNDNINNANFLVDMEMDFSRESLEFNFECESPIADDEVEEQKVETMKIGLRLNCEAVMDAWSCQGCSPWTDGVRPQFNLDNCWPDFMGMWGAVGGEIQGSCGEGMRIGIGQAGNGDGGREARVLRYREKRRTRLFSKKIRYEVRKLNAEKRPRMKGRFVKRTSFPPPATANFTYV